MLFIHAPDSSSPYLYRFRYKFNTDFQIPKNRNVLLIEFLYYFFHFFMRYLIVVCACKKFNVFLPVVPLLLLLDLFFFVWIPIWQFYHPFLFCIFYYTSIKVFFSHIIEGRFKKKNENTGKLYDWHWNISQK